MKILSTTPDVAVPLAEFIAAHYPPAREWGQDALLPWVRWNIGEGFLAYVLDGDDIAGLAIVRPVMDPEHGRQDCRFDPEGSCLFIDLTIARTPLLRALLIAQFRQRFGLRKSIAYMRVPDTTLHVLPLARWYARVIQPLLTAFPPQPA